MKAVVLLVLVLFALSVTASRRYQPKTKYPIRNACSSHVRVVHAFGANDTNPPNLKVAVHYGKLGRVGNPGDRNGAVITTLGYGERFSVALDDRRGAGQVSVAAYYLNSSNTLALRTSFNYGPNQVITVVLSGPTLAPAQSVDQVFQTFPNSNPFVILEDATPFNPNVGNQDSNEFFKARFYNFLDGVATYDLRILDSLNKEVARISQVSQKTAETSTRLIASGSYSYQVTLKGATTSVASGNTTTITGVLAGRNEVQEFWLFGNPFTSKLPNTAKLHLFTYTATSDDNECNNLV